MKPGFLFALIFTTFSSPGFAETDSISSHWWGGYTLDLGLTTGQTSLSATDTDGTELGILTGKMGYAPFFSLGSPYHFFSESNFGYNFQYAYSSFSFKAQDVRGEDVDLGTSAKGNFFYAMPVFFYNFGTRHFNSEGKGHSFKMGTGIGPGYLSAKGDIIYTGTDQSKHNFNIKEKHALTLAIYVLFDYRYNNWVFRARGGGPKTYNNGLEYDLFDFAMDVGYAIRF
ncbi:MAG: hypothetical protein OEX07_04665 [Gammaproteobacteria bacterium]|nr:hypothetical protein [Gammaproteobacteria bacterium]